MKQWNAIVSALTTLFGVRLGMLCVLAIGLMGPGYAEAVYTAVVDGRTWSYTLGNNGQATLTNVDQVEGELLLPSRLNGHDVVGVEAGCFQNLANLERLVVPNSMTWIGGGAFVGSGIRELVLGDGIKHLYGYVYTNVDDNGDDAYAKYGAFGNCTQLTNIVFGSSLTNIGNQCFAQCRSLRRLTLPISLASIGVQSFYSCTSLTEVVFGPGVGTIGSSAFGKCTSLHNVRFTTGTAKLVLGNDTFSDCSALATVAFPGNLHVIRPGAFVGTTKLIRADIPDSVEWIGGGAFSGSGIRELRLGNGVRHLYGYNYTNVDDSNDDSYAKYGAFGNCTQLTNIVFGSSLTNIGNQCFAQCTALRALTLPNSLASVGVQGFYACTSLTKVVFGAGLTSVGASSFRGCTSLDSARFMTGKNQLVLGDDVFTDCSALEKVDFPGNLYVIRPGAFANTTKLPRAVIPDSVEWIGSRAFSGSGIRELRLGNGVKQVYGYGYTNFDDNGDDSYAKYGAFGNCTQLTNIVFGSSLTNIGNQCFAQCTALQTLTLPNSLMSVGVQGFYACTSLKEVAFGTGLKSLGTWAFGRCSSLRSVRFGTGTSSLALGESAFRDCPVLETVTLPDNLGFLGAYAFANTPELIRIDIPGSVVWINSGAFAGSGIRELVLGDGVKHLYGYWYDNVDDSNDDDYAKYGAFGNCTQLTNIVFGSSLTNIGNQCFAQCTALQRLSIPDSVEEIGNQGFYRCTSLEEVAFGSGLSSVGDWAFGRCTALRQAQFANARFMEVEGRLRDPVSLSLGSDAFRGCTALETVTLPSGEWGEIEGPLEDEYGRPLVVRLKIVGGLHSIGPRAFAGTSNLLRIDIPHTAKWIGGGAFTGSGIRELYLGDGVEQLHGYWYSNVDTYGDDGYAEYGAFGNCMQLTNVVFGVSLTNIGNQCFAQCTSLRTLTLPDSLVSIGVQGFYACTSLTEVVFGTALASIGTSAFGNCTSLHNAQFTTGDVQLVLGDDVFSGCSALETIDFPGNLYAIRAGAFTGTTNLLRADIPDSVDWIGSRVFVGSGIRELVLGDGVKQIYGYGYTNVDDNDDVNDAYAKYGAFGHCTQLTNIVFGSSLTNIGNQCFAQCSALKTLTFPTSLVSIGIQCFYGNLELEAVSFSEGLRSIGSASFAKTPNLTRLDIPGSVEWIGSGTFSGSGIRELTLGEGLKCLYGNTGNAIDTSGDDGYAKYGAFGNCTQLTNVTFGSSLTTIGNQCFAQCTALQRLLLPDSLESIGIQGFYGCTSLTKVTLGNGLKTIGAYAFGNCPALRALHVGTGIETIGNSAFGNASNLRYVYFHGPRPPTLGANVFSGAPEGLVFYAKDGGTGWNGDQPGLPSLWYGHTIKWGSEYSPDADAPYDFQFTAVQGWPTAFFLSSTRDGEEAATTFLEGDPIYVSVALHEVWGDEILPGVLTNRLELVGVGQSDHLSVGGDTPGMTYASRGIYLDYLQGLPVGQYVFRCVLNSEGQFTETDYSNNTNTIPFEVVPSVEISFVSEDNVVAARRYPKAGTYEVLPDAPRRLGYRFLGWFTEEENGAPVTTSSRVPDLSTTLYAHWVVAPTETKSVSGTINSDTTWTFGNLYKVTGTLSVRSGATLTIEPGVVVKFSRGTALFVNGGAVFSALGTRVNPIVFTSLDDDENGGKTQGSDSVPENGDWKYIEVAGRADFNYCKVMYGAPSNESGLVQTRGGMIVMDNSFLAHGKYDGIHNWGNGDITLRNTVITDVSAATGAYTGKNRYENCVFYDCNYGPMHWSHWAGRPEFVNCIFARLAMGWTDSNSTKTQFQKGMIFRRCCFWNPPGIGPQICDMVGVNGCFMADPKFVNPENGDFRIMGNSPCVDAGDGTIAPEKDYYGTPRMNVDGVRPTGVASVNGAVPDIGIYEVPGSGDIPSADLTVTQVTAPDEMTVGESVEIQWTVKNVGEETASGIWRDEIELVAANGQVLSMGTISTQADIKPGASANFRSTVTVPPAPEGAVQIRLTANKYQDVFECLKVENNAYSVLASLSVSTLNVPADGNGTVISIGSGSENGFAVNVPGGASAVLVIRGEGELKAWLGSGALSSSDTAIRTAVQVGDGLWLLQIPAGTDARVTLSNEGQEAVDIGLSMEVGDFFIFDTGLTAAIVNGASITLTGNGFDESMVCEIVQNGNVVATATDVIVSDSVQATAVFNLASLVAGNYTLRVTKGKDSASANLSLEYSKTGSKWTRRLEMASTIRSGRVYTGAFTYGNTGGAPMLAPYVILKAKSGTLIRLSESDAWTDTIEFLACSDTYPASVLKAGDTSKLTFFYKTTGNRANVSFECTFDSTKAFPWDVNGQYMRPSWASDEMWNIAFSTLKTNVGATWNDFFDRMRANCDHLMKLGQPMKRLDRFWQIEINEALGVDHAIQTLAGGTDLARTGRGMGLSFSRIYGSSLSSRLMTGELGYGWKGNYSTYAELINSTTLAFHLPSGSTYQFTKVSGVWASEDARDKTQLSETTDAYILTYIDGTVQTVSKSNMRTSLIRDNQGNELLFTYNGNQLQKIQHSDGQSLTFTWSSGKVASVTDDQGRKVIYGYTGDLLTSVTAFNGFVTRYVYHTADSTPMSRALKQIVYPDGTTKDYTYDNIGRVATISVNGNKFTTEIVRGLCGSYSVIAPNGGVTEVTVGAKGEMLKTVNALGQIVQQKYTADTQLESIIAPSGKRNKVNYNKDGQIMSTASASGAETSFAYEPNFDNLASITDAKGHAISYGYDDKGRGNSISYVDGSMSSLEYNEKGDVAKATNRRGETIEYEYDAEGNLTKKIWQNGRTFTLAYDAKGNVTNAIDSVTGAVTMEYDANERLTRIVYPKNRGFTYKYDSIGRITERASLDGIKQCYSYDSLGRLLKVTDGANAYLTNAYDPTTGWLTTQTYGNGTVVSNAYDILGRTVGIYHSRTGGSPVQGGNAPAARSTIAFFEYAYDVDGKCISQTTAEGKESYTYDADGQLTSVTYPDGTSESFTYDAVGNRISRTGGSPVQNETYTVNNLNQYTEIVNAQAVRSTMEYDLDGNVTRKGDTRYWYDTLNRLIAVTNEAENIRWSCEYDVFGNRISVTDNGTTTERLFVQGSPPSVAAEYQGNTLIKSHVLVGAVRIADISRTGGSPVQDSTTRYYHGDMLGSARLLTDGTGATKGTRSFKAFGETRTSTGETTDAGYVGTFGVETDSNGLFFMRNRYYDADTGRFMQMDPIGLNGGDVNVYRYCGNDGIVFVDPSGKSSFACKVAKAEGVAGPIITFMGTVGAFLTGGGTTPIAIFGGAVTVHSRSGEIEYCGESYTIGKFIRDSTGTASSAFGAAIVVYDGYNDYKDKQREREERKRYEDDYDLLLHNGNWYYRKDWKWYWGRPDNYMGLGY